jgi:hypothetical protein
MNRRSERMVGSHLCHYGYYVDLLRYDYRQDFRPKLETTPRVNCQTFNLAVTIEKILASYHSHSRALKEPYVRVACIHE